jgi:hypothetical protein
LVYEMKFLVPNYSCLQNSWLGAYRPQLPRSLCPLSSTEFVEPPQTKFLGTPLYPAVPQLFSVKRQKATFYSQVPSIHGRDVGWGSSRTGYWRD